MSRRIRNALATIAFDLAAVVVLLSGCKIFLVIAPIIGPGVLLEVVGFGLGIVCLAACAGISVVASRWLARRAPLDEAAEAQSLRPRGSVKQSS
jgi:hypothetical protein